MATSTLYWGLQAGIPLCQHPTLAGWGVRAGSGRGRQVRVAVYIPNPHRQRFPPRLPGIRGSGAPGAQPGLSLPFKEQR